MRPWHLFRTKLPPRDDDLPKLFDYFSDPAVTNFGAIEITLTASIQSQQMRDSNISPQILSTGKLAEHPWSIFQLLAQQTLNGCNLRAGDLIGTGTVSGPNEGQQACLHEISIGGIKEFALSSGELRTYLRDGDEVIFNARCQKMDIAVSALGRLGELLWVQSNEIYKKFTYRIINFFAN